MRLRRLVANRVGSFDEIAFPLCPDLFSACTRTASDLVEISVAWMGAGTAVLPASAELVFVDGLIRVGQAEISAGSGTIIGLEITRQSGPFEPSLMSLDIARKAFRKHGIDFPE